MEVFLVVYWLVVFLVLLGCYGNEEIILGFFELIMVCGW